MARRVIACVAALSVLVVAGCSSHPARPKTPRASAVAVVPGQIASLPHQDVTVTTAAPLKGKVASYFAGGQIASLGPDGKAVFSMPRNSAGIVIGYDAQHRPVATAVTITIAGVRPVPVPVDWTSTAFTRLVTTPPFVTSDPAELVVLRAAAEQSPHLSGLAREIEDNARTNTRYMTTPTVAEAGEFAALVQDVFNTLNAWSVSVGGPRLAPASLTSAQRGVTLPAVYQKAAAATTPAGYTPARSLTIPRQDTAGCNTGMIAYGAPGGTGVCVTSVEQSGGRYRVMAENRGPSAALIFSADNPLIPLGVFQARTFRLPTITEIITAIVENTAALPVRAIITNGCKVARWLGSDICGSRGKNIDEQTAFAQTVKAIAKVFTDVNSAPQTEFMVLADEAKKPLYVVTTGGRPGDLTALPGGDSSQPDVQTARAVTTMLTLYSQVLKPLYELLTGVPGPKEQKPSAAAEDARSDTEMKAVKEILDNEEFRHDLFEAIVTTDLLAAMKAFVKLVIDVVTDAEILAAFLKFYGADVSRAYMFRVISDLLIKYGSDAIPGPGWLKAAVDAGDMAVKSINFGFGLYAMYNGVGKIDSFGGFESLNPDAAERLTRIDWDNFDGYYDQDVDASAGAPYAFPLKLVGGSVADANPWYSTVGTPGTRVIRKIDGVAYGTVNGQPCALVALAHQEDPVLRASAMTYLFGMDGQTPKLLAVNTLSGSPGAPGRIAIEDGKVVEYTKLGPSGDWIRTAWTLGGPVPANWKMPSGVRYLISETPANNGGTPWVTVNAAAVPAGPIAWNP